MAPVFVRYCKFVEWFPVLGEFYFSCFDSYARVDINHDIPFSSMLHRHARVIPNRWAMNECRFKTSYLQVADLSVPFETNCQRLMGMRQFDHPSKRSIPAPQQRGKMAKTISGAIVHSSDPTKDTTNLPRMHGEL